MAKKRLWTKKEFEDLFDVEAAEEWAKSLNETNSKGYTREEYRQLREKRIEALRAQKEVADPQEPEDPT